MERSRDRGATLVELTAVIAIVGVLSTALLAGIAVLLRTNPRVTRAIAENHDEQQLTNYLYGDVRSTPAAETTSDAALGYSRATTATGCPGDVGLNVLQLTWSAGGQVVRASYRLVGDATSSRLDRSTCTGTTADALSPTGLTNIADALDAVPAGWNGTGAPAFATVVDGVVRLSLVQSGRTLSVSAALQTFGALPTVPAATTTTPTLPTTTTTTTPTTTTTTTTTTPPPTTPPTTIAPNALCSLLASVAAALQAPAAAAPLLRQYGADGVAGVLTTPVHITAAASASVSLGLLGLQLNLSACATFQLAYNTGTTDVVVPMTAAATCTSQTLVLCLQVRIDLGVDLQVDPYQTWTSGTHTLALRTASGGPIVNGSSMVNVTVDPATVPTTTTTQPPVTVPPASASVNPLDPARGFSVMTSGDAKLKGTSSQGAVAVGGTFRFGEWREIATNAASTLTLPGESQPTGLMVGGGIDLASSSDQYKVSKGFAHLGALGTNLIQVRSDSVHVVRSGTASSDSSSSPRVVVLTAQGNDAANAVVKPGAFPFENSFVLMKFYASRIAALSPTTCADVAFPQFYEQYGNYVLQLVPNKVNVLNITAAQLNAIGNASGNTAASSTTPLIVNITDAGAISIPARYWSVWQNGDRTAVLWNVPNATSVSVGSTLYGTLYAPSAAVTMSSTQLYGDVVAASLTTNNGSIELAHFAKSVPCLA